jgi:hypothetical protein
MFPPSLISNNDYGARIIDFLWLLFTLDLNNLFTTIAATDMANVVR